MGERSLREPRKGFVGRADGDIYGLGVAVYKDINFHVEPGLSTELP